MVKERYFNSPWRVLGFAALVLVTFIWLVPFMAALLTSVRTNDDLMLNGFISLPSKISLDSFVEALSLIHI